MGCGSARHSLGRDRKGTPRASPSRAVSWTNQKSRTAPRSTAAVRPLPRTGAVRPMHSSGVMCSRDELDHDAARGWTWPWADGQWGGGVRARESVPGTVSAAVRSPRNCFRESLSQGLCLAFHCHGVWQHCQERLTCSGSSERRPAPAPRPARETRTEGRACARSSGDRPGGPGGGTPVTCRWCCHTAVHISTGEAERGTSPDPLRASVYLY